MKTKYLMGILILILILLGSIFIINLSPSNERSNSDNISQKEAVVYKSPTCGCCVGYAHALEQEGYAVNVIEVGDMTTIKESHHIPYNMESCHTTVIEDYVIEGHIPFEAISILLETQPNIRGIALPGMPAGTPGMPGAKTETYTIYQINYDDSTSIFMEM